MSVSLTEGCLDKIMKGEKLFGPIVQVVDIRPVQSSGPTHNNKHRMTLNDGVNTYNGAYSASQITKLFNDHIIDKFHIVRLSQYCVSDFTTSKLMIVAGIEPIQACKELIGNPVPLGSVPEPKPEKTESTTAAAPSATPPSPMKSTNRIISSPTRQGQKVFTETTSSSDVTITPIKSLHPYQNMWTIRARVTNKSEMKEFARKTGTGTGKLFSVELIDAAGDEIRATAFNEVAEKLFDIMQVGHVYLISKGDVKMANKKFTTIAHSFEITFNATTVVSPVDDDVSSASIPSAHFSFVPIEQIAAKNKDELVDVLGVVTQATDIQTFSQKSTGRELTKRSLTLLDNTSYSIEVTLWGDKAKTEGIEVGSIVAIRAARVGTFNAKSLSTSVSSQVMVSPPVPDTKKLATWYEEYGKSTAVNAISGSSATMGEGGHPRDEEIKTIAMVHAEQLGKNTQADFFSCVACITTIKHDKKFSYTACPACNSKVTVGGEGKYHCLKCSKIMPDAIEVYSLNMQIADNTGSMYVSCFRDVAYQIMNERPASELLQLQTEAREAELNMAFDDAAHRWFLFRIRAQQQTYHEDVRTAFTVYSATPIDYTKECQRLVSIIDSYP